MIIFKNPKMFKKSLLVFRRNLEWSVRELNCKKAYTTLSHKQQIFSQKTNLPASPFWKINSLNKNCRSFAKGTDLKKDKKRKIKVDEAELAEFFDMEKLYKEIGKPLESLRVNLSEFACLRSTHGAIENLKVEFEGDKYCIQDLAEVGKKNPRLYVLDFSSFPQTIPTVMNALQKSDLNLNVQQEGTRVFVPIPRVTREHREALAKKSNLFFQKCKEEIREIQMRYIKKVRNLENLSEDIKFRVKKELTALGDKQILIAEELLKAKHDDLMKEDNV